MRKAKEKKKKKRKDRLSISHLKSGLLEDPK